MDTVDTIRYILKKFLGYSVAHVADGDVRPWAVADLHHLHDQVRIPYPASHHRRIEYDRFYEPVPGAAQGFVFIRFFDAPRRISPTVDRDAGFIAFDEKTSHSGKQILEYLIEVSKDIYFDVGNAFPWKLCCICRHILFLNAEKGIHDLQHGFIFHKPVYKIKWSTASSDHDIPLDDIKALLYRKYLIDVCGIFFPGSSYFLCVWHNDSSYFKRCIE